MKAVLCAINHLLLIASGRLVEGGGEQKLQMFILLLIFKLTYHRFNR